MDEGPRQGQVSGSGCIRGSNSNVPIPIGGGEEAKCALGTTTTGPSCVWVDISSVDVLQQLNLDKDGKLVVIVHVEQKKWGERGQIDLPTT